MSSTFFWLPIFCLTTNILSNSQNFVQLSKFCLTLSTCIMSWYILTPTATQQMQDQIMTQYLTKVMNPVTMHNAQHLVRCTIILIMFCSFKNKTMFSSLPTFKCCFKVYTLAKLRPWIFICWDMLIIIWSEVYHLTLYIYVLFFISCSQV